MDKTEFKKLFSNFNKLNVLIVGDVMVDTYVWGQVSRMSPEAPVPVLLSKTREDRLGGAANVALNVQGMGANPVLCSVIGEGNTGIRLMELLSKNNISNKGVVLDKLRKTTNKTRLIANNQQLIRVDDEDIFDIDNEISNRLIEKIRVCIEEDNIHVIIVQDYNKGVVTDKVIDFITDAAKKQNIPVLVDPKKQRFKYYKNVALFKPNLKELNEGLDMEIDTTDIEKLKTKLRGYIKEKNISSMLLTLSQNGIVICSETEFYHLPAEVRDIADVSGAGDTVISIAALCLALHVSLYDIAYISNMAGGLVCEKFGVLPVNKEILFRELSNKYLSF